MWNSNKLNEDKYNNISFFLEIILENLASVYIGQIYRMVLAFYSYCGDKNLGAMMRNEKNV